MYRKLKDFFIGQELSREEDLLVRANINMVYMIISFVILLLLTLQVIYCFTEHGDQIIAGAVVLTAFTVGLFHLRRPGGYMRSAHGLLLVSCANAAYTIYLYQAVPTFVAFIIFTNILFAFHILGMGWGFLYAFLLFLVLFGFQMVDQFQPAWFYREPVVHSPLEDLIVINLLFVLVVVLLYYYQKAYRLNSRRWRLSMQELDRAKKSAEDMNRLKTNFLSNMSHEIRTPLNGVLGINQVMADQITDPELIECLRLQRQSGTRLLKTIESILDLSKLESEQSYFHPVRVNVVQLCTEVVMSLRDLAGIKGLDISFHAENPNAFVFVDETMLYQVLNNIIGNAIKFTEHGSVRTQVDVSASDQLVRISVIDSGVGISPDFLSRIFEPFEQESQGTSRKFQGTGLGLSISKRYIELMGGQISVKSEKNQGAEFTVTLPLNNG